MTGDQEGSSERAERATTVVVVAGGDEPDPRAALLVPDGAIVLAADSGADHALRLGLQVRTLIGDLDSVSAGARETIVHAGGSIDQHPVAKDATDLELALHEAGGCRPAAIIVIGGHGGRADHHLAGLLMLAAPWLAPTPVTAWHGGALVTVLRPSTAITLRGDQDSLLSLIPASNPAGGITTTGLAYALKGEDLPFGSTRGVSNVMVDREATVRLDTGVLLAVQPAALEHHLARHASRPADPPTQAGPPRQDGTRTQDRPGRPVQKEQR